MNKAEKSLRWVVNQIPDFKPTTNEEKMLVAIKLYSEAGAEEIKRLEVENAALRERLDKAVELPRIEQSPYNGMFNGQTINDDTLLYYIEDGHIKQECFNNKFPEQLQKRLTELKGEKK